MKRLNGGSFPPMETASNPVLRRHNGTILWLGGWSMTNAVFARLHAALPDFRHAAADYGAADSADEMVALTESAARNLRSPATGHPLLIAGWSLGGLLALRLAAQGLADGLVLLAATARFTRAREQADLGWPDVHVRRMAAALAKDRQAVETRFRQTLFTDAEWKDGLAANLPPSGSWTTQALLSGLHVLRDVECLSRLPEIDCPVWLVHGREDQVCPYGAAEEMLSRLPHAELLSIAGCGHVPFMGRETILAEAIRRWWHGQPDKRRSAPI